MVLLGASAAAGIPWEPLRPRLSLSPGSCALRVRVRGSHFATVQHIHIQASHARSIKPQREGHAHGQNPLLRVSTLPSGSAKKRIIPRMRNNT